MNEIHFEPLPPHEDEPGEVRIIIDGADLIDLAREVELPFATREGSPDIAGGYAGLKRAAVTPPSTHFLGEPNSRIHEWSDRIQVLECDGCREPGCWPLFCRIEVTEDRVRWSDFEQPHRSGSGGGSKWDHRDLGPFEFDRAQYERALAALPRVE